MKVELLHHTPLWIASKAIRKCWASEDKSDTVFTRNGNPYKILEEEVCNGEILQSSKGIKAECGENDKALIERVGNKNKHSSTLEHLNYSFDIDGISRACLQELARHRHASMSVKSTRYTLKELREEPVFDAGFIRDVERARAYIVFTGANLADLQSVKALEGLRHLLNTASSNDIAKYCLPESYKTSLVWTINARSLQNFLSLRTDKSALWEIRDLANEIFNQLPEEHKYLFVDFVKEN